jgi:multidrug efflux pump subunit AcrA (membrane-fusion protein)
MKKSVKKALFFLIALSSAAFISCGKKKSAASDEDAESVYAVNAQVVRQGNLDNYLEFGGDVSSVSAVDVHPDASGKISRILVSVGDSVKKGQIIAYVDPSLPGMNYSESPVKSPIAGRITSFPPTLGTMVSQMYSVAQVSDTEELQIKINVAERYVSRISDNQVAVVTFDAYPGVEFSARVFEVSPVLDTASRTLLVKLKIDPADSRIRAGMYARVRLITDVIEDAVVVPSTAIVYRNGKPYIFVTRGTVEAGGKTTVQMIGVREGLTVDNQTEIQSGLKKDDIIIVKGQSLLSDDSRVKVVSVSQPE